MLFSCHLERETCPADGPVEPLAMPWRVSRSTPGDALAGVPVEALAMPWRVSRRRPWRCSGGVSRSWPWAAERTCAAVPPIVVQASVPLDALAECPGRVPGDALAGVPVVALSGCADVRHHPVIVDVPAGLLK
jgi:hypothetical protein